MIFIFLVIRPRGNRNFNDANMHHIGRCFMSLYCFSDCRICNGCHVKSRIVCNIVWQQIVAVHLNSWESVNYCTSSMACLFLLDSQNRPSGPPLLAPAPQGYILKEPLLYENQQMPVFCVINKQLPGITSIHQESRTLWFWRKRLEFRAVHRPHQCY